MVLAVGDKEVAELENRFKEFQTLFPKLKKINKEEIGRIEPNVIAGRNPREKLLALFTNDGYAVNYKKLSQSFIFEARQSDKIVDIF